MKFSELDFKQLLPAWMRKDPTDQALAKTVDELTQKLYTRSDLLKKWTHLDELSDEQLDALANELDVSWYYSGADKEPKVNVLKNAALVRAQLGTDYAVNQTIKDYFGGGKVVPWYEYDGEPYHFEITTDNVQNVADNVVVFLDILEKVKRASTILDALVITMKSEDPVYAGFAYHDLTIERVVFSEEA